MLQPMAACIQKLLVSLMIRESERTSDIPKFYPSRPNESYISPPGGRRSTGRYDPPKFPKHLGRKDPSIRFHSREAFNSPRDPD
jgi:hypothetical protein